MIDLVTAAELCSRMKIGKDRLRTLMSTPDFPKPVEKLKPKLYFREADVASWIAPAAPEPYSYGFTDQCRAESFIRFLGNDFVSTEMSVVRLNEAKADSAVEVFVVRCHRREALDEFWAHCREGGE